MCKKFYKFFLAMLDNKLLLYDKLFIVSYNIKVKKYVFWYINENGIPKFFDSCETKDTMEFKWNILMNKRR